MARLSIDAPERDQANAVLDVIEQVLGDAVSAVYLYGSAVVGGVRPGSDLDLFAVVSRPTTHIERSHLVELLVPISRRGRRRQDWRPVELTVVVESDIKPWRYPPRTEFQYGEWLRDRFEAGDIDPEDENNPDLAVLMGGRFGRGAGHRPRSRRPDQAARQTLNTIGAHVEQVPRRRDLRDRNPYRLR